jgi:hypothetical protein
MEEVEAAAAAVVEIRARRALWGHAAEVREVAVMAPLENWAPSLAEVTVDKGAPEAVWPPEAAGLWGGVAEVPLPLRRHPKAATADTWCPVETETCPPTRVLKSAQVAAAAVAAAAAIPTTRMQVVVVAAAEPPVATAAAR